MVVWRSKDSADAIKPYEDLDSASAIEFVMNRYEKFPKKFSVVFQRRIMSGRARLSFYDSRGSLLRFSGSKDWSGNADIFRRLEGHSVDSANAFCKLLH